MHLQIWNKSLLIEKFEEKITIEMDFWILTLDQSRTMNLELITAKIYKYKLAICACEF